MERQRGNEPMRRRKLLGRLGGRSKAGRERQAERKYGTPSEREAAYSRLYGELAHFFEDYPERSGRFERHGQSVERLHLPFHPDLCLVERLKDSHQIHLVISTPERRGARHEWRAILTQEGKELEGHVLYTLTEIYGQRDRAYGDPHQAILTAEEADYFWSQVQGLEPVKDSAWVQPGVSQ